MDFETRLQLNRELEGQARRDVEKGGGVVWPGDKSGGGAAGKTFVIDSLATDYVMATPLAGGDSVAIAKPFANRVSGDASYAEDDEIVAIQPDGGTGLVDGSSDPIKWAIVSQGRPVYL